MQKFKRQLALVFDDNLRTKQWQNIADWVIIGLIIVSTVEVFLSTFDPIANTTVRWSNSLLLNTSRQRDA